MFEFRRSGGHTVENTKLGVARVPLRKRTTFMALS